MSTDGLGLWVARSAGTRSPRVAMRCLCTGESPNMVRRQRGQFEEVSREFVPAAVTGGQAELEAVLLSAVTRTMAGMRRRGHPVRSTSLVRRVQLSSRFPALAVDEQVAGHLLAGALPRFAGDDVVGVPGLRAQPGRAHLDLKLVGPGGEVRGQVRLLGVSRGCWREATGGLPLVTGPLRDREISRVTGPARLMSGVLRRLPLWHGAAWLDTVPVGASLEIYWRGGPPGAAVAAILTESFCAVPDSSADSYNVSESVRCVRLRSGQGHACREPEWAWLQLMVASTPGPATNEVAVRSPSELVPGVWEHDDMRVALAHRDIGVVYRLLERHGVPRARIAELTGQSPAEVAEVVAGREVRSYEALSRIATGLGVPRGYMGLAFDEVTTGPCDCDDDETVKRRRFLAHAAAVTVGAAVFGDYRPTWGPCAHQRAIGV